MVGGHPIGWRDAGNKTGVSNSQNDRLYRPETPGRDMQRAQSASQKGIRMSSILTNNSAMVALQTLKSVNKAMTETQSQISTDE